MNVQLTEDQKSLVRQAIESGRYRREEDAVEEALLLWETRERRREEILAAVDQAEAEYARGEGRVIRSDADIAHLMNEIRQRGMDRLKSEQKPAE